MTEAADALERALVRPSVRPALALLTSAETVVVAQRSRPVLDALTPFLRQLLASGARRNRVELVMTGPEDPSDPAVTMPVPMRGLRTSFHDPARASWHAVRIRGEPIELDDVLRESEAIVLAGIVHQRDPSALTRLLVPGLASPAVRRMCTTGTTDAIGAEVAAALGVELVIALEHTDRWRAYVGPLDGMQEPAAWS